MDRRICVAIDWQKVVGVTQAGETMTIIKARRITAWRVSCILLCLFTLGQANKPANGAVELSDLLQPGGSFTANSLVFDQFTFSSSGLMPSAAGVLVDTITDAGGNVGIRVSGGFTDSNAVDGASTLELGYRVSAPTGSGFVGATLAGNPAVIGQGSFTITEASNGFEMSLVVFDAVPGETSLLESVTLDGSSSALDIMLSLVGDVSQGAGTASFVDQTFAIDRNQNNVIPEPASVLIWLGIMATGLVWRFRSRNRV